MKKRRLLSCILIVSIVLNPLIPTFARERNKTLPPARPSSRKVKVPSRVQKPTRVSGQTTTSLPDGRLLLIGGEGEDGPRVDTITVDEQTGETVVLPRGLHHARAWHSATILPDGRVLIVGGIGADKKVLATAEIFDPDTQMSELLPAGNVTGRAYHTATLLTEGQVLLAGGISQQKHVLNKAELWDFRTKRSTKLQTRLAQARQKHRATLMPDGNVVFEGGVDDYGSEFRVSELYKTENQDFAFTSISTGQDEGSPYFAGSVPRNGAVEVLVDALIALRFSKPLRPEAVSTHSVKLVGAEGTIASKIVLAENGRLCFVIPKGSLLSGATYSVMMGGATDGPNEIPNSSITFTTKEKGQPANRFDTNPDWLPSADNLRGNWKSKFEKSPWEELAPLDAAPGETALSGRVLTLTGQPLAGVTLRIADRTTRTDHSGRFLLTALKAGRQVLLIDGRSAGTRGKVYGTFKAGVEVTPNQTNVLPFTIWMPRLDMGHAVNIPSPTTTEIVITNPLIPGLELRLPPGTLIRDFDGQPVTQISITPVPVDRPPFPLPPGFNVPVFASIQPGGARIIPPQARLIYPNYTNSSPGSRLDFWNYDADEKGWYIYGQGTVSEDGRQVIPDPGVAIYEFSGIMISSGGNPPELFPKPCDDCDTDGDPVDLSTGLFVYQKTDLILPDIFPIVLQRTYRPQDGASRAFGIGATFLYDMFLWSTNNYQEADLIMPGGARVHYVRISPGTGWQDAVYEHTTSPGNFYKSRISRGSGSWELKFRDGSIYVLPDAGPVKSISDRYGNQITITTSFGRITKITSPNGRWVQFTYDSFSRITQATDSIGRTVGYAYDSGGRLWKVTDPAGGVTEYTYDSSHRMLTIKDARGIVFLTNQYDSNGRVISQTQADNSTYQFAYTIGGNGKISQTDVTDPRGNVRRVTFSSTGYRLTDTSAVGQPEQQTITIERQANTNFPLKVTDSLNRKTTYTYDGMGNRTGVTELAETSEAVTTTISYEPVYNQPTSFVDPLNHATVLDYDYKGNLLSISDPINHVTSFTYNPAGQIVSSTNPAGNITQWGYDSGDLTSITNPLGHSSSRFLDGAGRPIRITDALGRIRRYEYDALNQVVQTVDPLGEITAFDYDENGNLISLTDANGNVTSYDYNGMDRVVSRTDPLSREETYQYDANGNVTQVTDRKGQVTSYAYDSLDRLTLVTYADASSTSFAYDSGNRLTEIIDSISGTITLTYDNLDRVLTETNPRGSVTYTYDAADRRTSTTVAGQSTVNYSYDAADRLTSISQGQNSVGFTYDAADRTQSKTLPGNVTVEYGYDANSNLTSILYRHGTNVLGDLTYEYDALRRRTKVAGAFARVSLPSALTSSIHDAGNQLIQRGTTSLSYDANGNLTSDGVNTYTWDARDQLVSISGSATASFQYDAFGRRISSTTGGQTVGYLYDGADVVQEQTQTSPSANMLVGGLDEVLIRTDSGGMRTLVRDALGSSLALLDSSGVAQTEYTYEPFGKTTNTGTASSNPSQFTGRENDGTGLYYYRARYYSPALQRFISEDPIGFGGGDVNLYAYVGNDPINGRDPSGEILDTVIDLASVGYDIYALQTGGRKDRTANLIALGLDLVALFIPLVSGLGIASRASRSGLKAYETGRFCDLKRLEKAGDGLEIHHMVQKHPAKQIIKGYDPHTGPAIALPYPEHRSIPTARGPYPGTPKDLLDDGIKQLRDHTKTPEKAIRKLRKLNKSMYPEAF